MSRPMRLIPESDRPREKLLRLGAEKLDDEELLAILIGSGTPGRSALDVAIDLLAKCEERSPNAGLRGLFRLRNGDLKSFVPGLGPAKRCFILAALQLGFRLKEQEAPKRPTLRTPDAVYELVRAQLEHLDHEELLVIAVNAKHLLIDVECVTKGTLTSTPINPKTVFQSAMRLGAWGIILVHNHPSGDPHPSREDRGVTRRIVEAGALLGIHVLDHVIIGDRCFVSLRDEGLVDWSQ
ncbi:MAG TPA: DNA repair protein RadC [Symbiobacteriaceae bacterium]|nr:DNA repair protein RadC [Symbiobacteriaceae bacterium]